MSPYINCDIYKVNLQFAYEEQGIGRLICDWQMSYDQTYKLKQDVYLCT